MTQGAGIVVWLHRFSPAKRWIDGLEDLHKPLLQFHTQYNTALPWGEIDMDFMNINQTAHDGREFGVIGARMPLEHQCFPGIGSTGDSTALGSVDAYRY